MLRSTQSVLVVALGSAACAGQPSSPAPAPAPAAATVMQQAAAAQPPAPVSRGLDPAGTYEVETVAEGASVKFTTRIVKNADGSYGGTVTSIPYGQMSITSLKVTGKRVDFTIATADGTPVGVYFVLEGSAVTGEWATGADGYKLAGKKLP